MKIKNVVINNHRRAFEVVAANDATYTFPYARLRVKPTVKNRVAEAWPDPELGAEAFTYVLEGGESDTIHIDTVLEYNEDAGYLKDLLLYRLTLEARKRVAASALSKREMIRRLRTSASQFYRLLDPANNRKSIGQLVALLHILGCEVDLVVRDREQGERRSA